jgi:hypothetical protein
LTQKKVDSALLLVEEKLKKEKKWSFTMKKQDILVFKHSKESYLVAPLSKSTNNLTLL